MSMLPVYADPGAAARGLFDAIEAGRWSAVAAFVDDASAETFKGRVLEAVHEEEELRLRELAVRPSNGHEAPTLGAPYLCAWYGVESIEALEAMPAHEVIARAAQAAEESRFDEPAGDFDALPTVGIERSVIGHVFERETLAHIVFREVEYLSDGDIESIEVLSFVRTDEGAFFLEFGDVIWLWFRRAPSEMRHIEIR